MSHGIDVSLAVILRWPTAVAHKWCEQLISDVVDDSNVLAVVAVGSSVRVDVQSEDLDLVVLCNERKRFQFKPPIEIDIQCFERASVTEELRSGHPLLGWAVLYGRAVFDRNRTWAELSTAWRERVPLPDPVVARKRAARVLTHLRTVREMGDDVAASELEVSHLTLLARASLAERHVYPASRPELAGQLRSVGEPLLANQLQVALQRRGRLLSQRVS